MVRVIWLILQDKNIFKMLSSLFPPSFSLLYQLSPSIFRGEKWERPEPNRVIKCPYQACDLLGEKNEGRRNVF